MSVLFRALNNLPFIKSKYWTPAGSHNGANHWHQNYVYTAACGANCACVPLAFGLLLLIIFKI